MLSSMLFFGCWRPSYPRINTLLLRGENAVRENNDEKGNFVGAHERTPITSYYQFAETKPFH